MCTGKVLWLVGLHVGPTLASLSADSGGAFVMTPIIIVLNSKTMVFIYTISQSQSWLASRESVAHSGNSGGAVHATPLEP